MKLRKVQLNQFRRFTNLTIDLGDNPADIVALVGPNGSGKSAIFDAFEEKLRTVKGSKNSPPAHFFSKKWFAKDPAVHSENYTRDESINLEFLPAGIPIDKKTFSVRSPYRYTSQLSVSSIQNLPDVLDDQRRPGVSTGLDDRLVENYQRLLNASYREYMYGTKTGTELRLQLLGKINGVLRDVLDIEITDLGDVLAGKGQLYFKKGQSQEFPFENLSSGEKEVVDLVIDMVVKSPEYNATIYCIDEPELHISTAIQRKLLTKIVELIPENCQLWIATHSIGFLRALQQDLADKTQLFDFSQHNLDEQIILTPTPKTRTNWARIFKTALDDITGLIAPSRIIYCEGRAESAEGNQEQGFDAEVYNTIFEHEFYDTLFVSSGGSTDPDRNASIALKVLNKAFQEVELWLLKDRDIKSDGSLTSNEVRTQWLAGDSTRRMLGRIELENYLIDYEIISKKYPLVQKNDFDAVAGDLINERGKEKVGSIKTLCGVDSVRNLNNKEFLLGLVREISQETVIYQELKGVIFGENNVN